MKIEIEKFLLESIKKAPEHLMSNTTISTEINTATATATTKMNKIYKLAESNSAMQLYAVNAVNILNQFNGWLSKNVKMEPTENWNSEVKFSTDALTAEFMKEFLPTLFVSKKKNARRIPDDSERCVYTSKCGDKLKRCAMSRKKEPEDSDDTEACGNHNRFKNNGVELVRYNAENTDHLSDKDAGISSTTQKKKTKKNKQPTNEKPNPVNDIINNLNTTDPVTPKKADPISDMVNDHLVESSKKVRNSKVTETETEKTSCPFVYKRKVGNKHKGDVCGETHCDKQSHKAAQKAQSESDKSESESDQGVSENEGVSTGVSESDNDSENQRTKKHRRRRHHKKSKRSKKSNKTKDSDSETPEPEAEPKHVKRVLFRETEESETPVKKTDSKKRTVIDDESDDDFEPTETEEPENQENEAEDPIEDTEETENEVENTEDPEETEDIEDQIEDPIEDEEEVPEADEDDFDETVEVEIDGEMTTIYVKDNTAYIDGDENFEPVGTYEDGTFTLGLD